MSEAFFADSTTLDDVTYETKASSGDWPFWLEKGKPAKIVILNADDDKIPTIHYHNVYDPDEPDEKKRYKKAGCTASKALGGYCHYCEYTKAQPEKTRWKTAVKKERCFSILADDGKEDDEGNAYPPRKCIRLSGDSDIKEINKLRHTVMNDPDFDFDKFQYTKISVVRTNEEKSPRVGTIGQASPKQFDPESVEDATPHTLEEIMKWFVLDKEELARIATHYPLEKIVDPDSIEN